MNQKIHHIGLAGRALSCIVIAIVNQFAAAQTYVIYDPSLGTLPEAQGFVRLDNGLAPSPTVSGGVLNQNTSGN